MALVWRVGALCALMLTVPASAAPAATWRQVTGFGKADSTTLAASVARADNGVLNVGWSQGQTVLNTQVSADGKTVSAPRTVFSYEQAAGAVAMLAVPGGGLRAFFTGLDGGKKPHDTLMSTATSADGVTWAVQPSAASDSKPGDNSPVYAAGSIGGTIWQNGTVMSIWPDPQSGRYHVGTDDKVPDLQFGGTATGPDAETDSATGQVAIGWQDLDTGLTNAAVVQTGASPFPPGPTINVPGGRAPDHGHPVDMASRSTGAAGIFLAYLRGTNPFDAQPAVWRLGSSKPMLLTGREGRLPGLARSVQGRLWAFWTEGNYTGQKRRIFARRSNKQATRFGAAVPVKPPSGTNDGNVWALDGAGTADGRLDLMALFQRDAKGDSIGNYVTRVQPGITLLAKALGNGQVRFTTRDAGAKLATTIHFAGKTAQTGSDGVVEMQAQPRRKRYLARATRDGYHPAARKVKLN